MLRASSFNVLFCDNVCVTPSVVDDEFSFLSCWSLSNSKVMSGPIPYELELVPDYLHYEERLLHRHNANKLVTISPPNESFILLSYETDLSQSN